MKSLGLSVFRLDAVTTDQIIRGGFLLVALTLLFLNIGAFFTWDQRRGVHDDLCYLRQAHLFQRFGLSGIDTNITRDDDGFFREAQKSIGLDLIKQPDLAICHPLMKNGKRVLQYPPGTGFFMSAFPEGSQVAWLFTTCIMVVMAGAIFLISIASLRASIAVAGLFGLSALYFMVNPTKASYSMAPTTAICIVAAILTPLLFMIKSPSRRLCIASLIGLLLGLSVSFRTANLLLVAGYIIIFGMEFLRRRDRVTFSTGAVFACAYIIGLTPSLIANYVNAGSPFSTTYGPNDVVPIDLTFSIVPQYLMDMQGLLAIVAIGATAWLFRHTRFWAPVSIVAINLIVSLGFFFTHPVITQYYIMPIITLALWSLLVQWLLEQRLMRLN